MKKHKNHRKVSLRHEIPAYTDMWHRAAIDVTPATAVTQLSELGTVDIRMAPGALFVRHIYRRMHGTCNVQHVLVMRIIGPDVVRQLPAAYDGRSAPAIAVAKCIAKALAERGGRRISVNGAPSVMGAPSVIGAPSI